MILLFFTPGIPPVINKNSFFWFRNPDEGTPIGLLLVWTRKV